MGDFNDDPNNKSVEDVLGAVGDREEVTKNSIFYNPMMSFYKKGIGTSCYRDKWNVLDQVHVSPVTGWESVTNWYFWKAGIFNPSYFSTNKKGAIRAILFEVLQVVNQKLTGGYSDHFPVYALLIKKQ